MKLPIRVLLTAVFASASLVACQKTAVKPPPAGPNGPGPNSSGGIESHNKYTRDSLDTDNCLRQRVVYFDFDKSEIRGEFQAAIACHAEFLREFPNARVTLEGNADERGTREYNMGLGERRGN